MIIKLRIGHIRIVFNIAQVIDVLGVNSKLPNGKHILMWDFDNQSIFDVIRALFKIQQQFPLPNIYILKSSEPNNYIAYCFKQCEWALARAIVGMTVGIDENFYKWAVFRRCFTLRVGAKLGIKPKLVHIMHNMIWEDATVEELRSWVKYETLDGHHNQKAYYIEVP